MGSSKAQVGNFSEYVDCMYKPGWFKDGGKKQILFRMYSLVGINSSDLENIAEEIITMFNQCLEEITINLAEYSNENFTSSQLKLISDSNGDPYFFHIRSKSDLPKGIYLFITAPLYENEIEHPQSIINQYVALIRLGLGNNMSRYCVSEEIIDIETFKDNAVIPVMLIPQMCEGPLLDELYLKELKNLLNNLADTTSDIRERVLLSMDFVYDAMMLNTDTSMSVKFVLYWSSLEVLMGKNGRKIFKPFGRIYNESHSYAQNNLGLGHLNDLRNEIIHQGKKLTLLPIDERYFQCLLLDAIRFLLDLKVKCYALRFISDFDYDHQSFGYGQLRVGYITE